MSTFAISILLISAVLHTVWNLLIKQSEDKYIVTFWMVTFGGLFAIVALFFTGLPPREMWVFAVISVCVEVAYFISLSYAYHDNDFSLIYPVARGAAPAFIAAWSFLFLRESLKTGGVIGLAFIIGGLVIIGVNALTQAHVTRVHFKGVAVALFIALLISIYSTIDGSAVKNGYALPYVMAMFALVPFVISPFVFRQYGWARIRDALVKQPVRVPLAGVLGVLAYLMAVFAYSIAPLSYAGAVREVSVVFGALAGWWLLKERMGGARVFGALVIFAGVFMIAVFG
ncbi:MAG TPA: DMT family transporter [Anaerolineales bacterium]|jgi:drug/metabolite transporter (DMT)-like permease|nr:DMT family transporter [Anaerolineales bacterium]HQX17022.1 DMT family transporter [Anaerolineales bacterium]